MEYKHPFPAVNLRSCQTPNITNCHERTQTLSVSVKDDRVREVEDQLVAKRFFGKKENRLISSSNSLDSESEQEDILQLSGLMEIDRKGLASRGSKFESPVLQDTTYSIECKKEFERPFDYLGHSPLKLNFGKEAPFKFKPFPFKFEAQ